MNTWKGLFTQKEAEEIITCIEQRTIKNDEHSNRDNLKIAVNEILGSTPIRDSIINKIESLTQEQVNEIINAAQGIARETSDKYSIDNLKYRDQMEDKKNSLINSVFNPQEE